MGTNTRLFLFVVIVWISGFSCTKIEDRQNAVERPVSAATPKEQPAETLVVKNTSLCILVTQKFGDAKDAFVPVATIVGRLLKPLGFRIVDSDSIHPDLTLRINLYGTPVGAGYMNAGFRYTGARVNGKFELVNSSGRKEDGGTFSGSCGPWGSVWGDQGATPSDAPFDDAFFASTFFDQLANVMTRKYGKDVTVKYWTSVLEENNVNSDLWAKSIAALGNLKDSRAISPLVTKFKDGVGNSEWELLIVNMMKFGKPGIDSLCAILASKDVNSYSRAMAARALGKMRDTSAASTLRETIESNESGLRIWSAFALYRLGETGRIETIVSALSPSDCNPALALKEIGDARAIEALIQAAYAEPSPCEAYSALSDLTGKGFDSKEIWLEWWKANKQKYAKRTTATSKGQSR